MTRSLFSWPKIGILVALGLPMVCFPQASWAAFLFCNQTSSTIEAAFGQRDSGVWVSQGWWKIEPKQCARVYNNPLSQRFYFFYARELALPSQEGKRPKTWSGKYMFCVDNKAFRIEGDGDCEKRNYRAQGFHEVDVGPTQKKYTLTFEDIR